MTPRPLPQAWDTAIASWVRYLKTGGVSRETIRTRRGHVESAARKTHTRHPNEITTQLLIDTFSQYRWSPEHRRGMRASLIQFFTHCITLGLCADNPAEGLPKVPESQPKPKPAPEWLWEDLLASAPPRELLMIRLAGEGGLRRQEIAKVQRDDVIWDGDGYSLIVHGKGNKQRIVPINDGLATVLQRGPGEWVPEDADTGYVFPSTDRWGNVIAKHMSPDRVGRVISALMPKGWTAHKLRHRYATRGFAVTHNLRAVQEALGHASVATTQRYTAVGSRDLRAVAEAVTGGDGRLNQP